jgi:hypothetical protein
MLLLLPLACSDQGPGQAPIRVDGGDPLSGTFESLGQVELRDFVAEQTGFVRLTLASPLDLTLTVGRADGTPLAAAAQPWTDVLAPVVAGERYLLEIEAEPGQSLPDGGAPWSLSASDEPVPFEPDDAAAPAQTVEAYGTRPVQLASDDDVDYLALPWDGAPYLVSLGLGGNLVGPEPEPARIHPADGVDWGTGTVPVLGPGAYAELRGPAGAWDALWVAGFPRVTRVEGDQAPIEFGDDRATVVGVLSGPDDVDEYVVDVAERVVLSAFPPYLGPGLDGIEVDATGADGVSIALDATLDPGRYTISVRSSLGGGPDAWYALTLYVWFPNTE